MAEEQTVKYCPHCGSEELIYNPQHNTYFCVDCYFNFEVLEVYYV